MLYRFTFFIPDVNHVAKVFKAKNTAARKNQMKQSVCLLSSHSFFLVNKDISLIMSGFFSLFYLNFLSRPFILIFKEITKHINRKNELELASRAASVGGTTGTGNVGRFTILKGLLSEGKKLNDKGGTKKKSKVKSGSKR